MRDTTRDTQLNQELNGIYTDINHLSENIPSVIKAHLANDGTDDIQLATSTQKGLMSSAYAAKLDGIEANANNYIHPATHSLDMITETPELKVMTADERDRLATMGGIPI